MNINLSTDRYEKWLGERLRLIPEDLTKKHHAMSTSAFSFLRATFYRWMQVWPSAAKEVSRAQKVLAVGDLHVANFGTWRDAEARLIWGINDFDEAYELPYTVDLVRLAVSAHMAINESHLAIEAKDACDAILAGYTAGIDSVGQPFVLAEQHTWLRQMVTGELRDPERFWAKLDESPACTSKVPASAMRAIERMTPGPDLNLRLVHRIAGLGSLGRERFVGIADHAGGRIAREAKALTTSACAWAAGARDGEIEYQKMLDDSVRAVDPFVKLKGRWIVRRLAPDCSRVELSSLPKERDESRLLRAMGFETANVHLGTKKAGKQIATDLKGRKRGWLHRNSRAMLGAVMADWNDWRKANPVTGPPEAEPSPVNALVAARSR